MVTQNNSNQKLTQQFGPNGRIVGVFNTIGILKPNRFCRNYSM